jgi:tRNA pseudouridine13 synthase
LKGYFEGAVLNYLSFSEGERDEESVAARKRLEGEKDFAQALEFFPRHLKYERLLLEHLALHPHDFVGALQKMPRHLVLMFIHAFQAKLFNELLDERLKDKKTWSVEEKGMLVGNDSTLGEKEKALLDKDGVSQDAFSFKTMPFLSSKGSERNYFAGLKDLEILGEKPLKIRFSLDAGCYATVALNWLLDKW